MAEQDNQAPESNSDSPNSEEQQSSTFPRRRRRTSLSAGSTPQASEAQTSTQHDTIDAEDNRADLSAKADSVPESVKSDSKPEKKGSEQAPADSAKTVSTDSEEEISPGRRAVRIAMMLAIIVVAGYVVWNMAEEGGSNQNLMAQLARGPEARTKHDNTAGDKLADDLEKRLHKGEFDSIVKQSDELLAKGPESVKLRRVLLKAATVRAVTLLAGKLDKLPKPRLADAATPVAENIAELEKRIKLLKVLDKHHKDWRDALLEIPAAHDVYARYQKEITSAPAVLASLQTGLSFLEQARAALMSKRPDFNKCTKLLRTAWEYLRLKELIQTAADSQHVAKALYLLNHHVVDQAVEHLKQANLGKEAGAKPPKAKTILYDIRTQLAISWKQAKDKVGAWDDLNTAQQQCREAYKRGNVDKAIAIIGAVMPKVDPDNMLTRSLARKLKTLNRHYTTVRTAWQKALKVKETKPIKEQLAAWAKFQRVLTDDDAYFTAAFRRELLAIKKIIVDRINLNYIKLQTREAGYKPITLQMRKPQNPRAPFAAAAKQLANMAIVAQKISDTAALVPNWRLGTRTEGKVDHARNILADLNDQARKLNNLYKLYKRLGKLSVARECLERVRLLGNSTSNPWYSEAVKILEGK